MFCPFYDFLVTCYICFRPWGGGGGGYPSRAGGWWPGDWNFYGGNPLLQPFSLWRLETKTRALCHGMATRGFGSAASGSRSVFFLKLEARGSGKPLWLGQVVCLVGFFFILASCIAAHIWLAWYLCLSSFSIRPEMVLGHESCSYGRLRSYSL